MSQNFKVGQRVRFTETFTDLLANTLADPTTVTLRLLAPPATSGGVGVETTYTVTTGQVVRASLGVFYFDFTFTAAGVWHARWAGSGAITAVDETKFTVEVSSFS